MVIKKFQGNTETEAIMLAKEELGKDAIVMNIKTVKPKGIYKIFKKMNVEVTAALDENLSYSGGKSAPKSNENFQVPKVSLDNFKDIIKEEESVEAKAGTSAIEEKLNSLQFLLEQQMSEKRDEKMSPEKQEEPNKNLNRNATYINLIFHQLLNNEVDEEYANQILKDFERTLNKDVSVDNILATIYQKIVLKLGQPKNIEIKPGKVKFVYFIGPTGVGKTTTIAKIASSFMLERKAKVALITSDTYRIAAVEQLRTYANILGIPLKVVYSEEEIREAREIFADYDLVLVDTAGRSHKNREQRDDIELLLSAIEEEEKEVYLVLSATTKYNDLIRIAETYQEITNYRLIFTKIDETNCVGNILNIRMLTNAPLSYATWGQNVPDDIGLINPQKIAKKLLGGK
ncbi:flagellar biosynthesis protein FlhF [Mobilisporobacter senegalensis]|uniref:Flagellar biosynthesis protein FlhF n=1 Tax=Mobilisporobacter senegalensis TaxID=1329262 RepID=A0A3N1XVX2_9FIRM|nr:flagellar biosynthesis protein FlhF [Mobilisporobacter senegalensis]ROR30784.1 flagellar biosynthesis protein FlhF [Mobilisporobacter senegalensis]